MTRAEEVQVDAELILPDDFDSYAWEVEAKGYFLAAKAGVSGREVPVAFYYPVRLAQDIRADLESGRIFVSHNLVVVNRVNREEMARGLRALELEFFDERRS